MKPAWDALGDLYSSSSTVIIGDVDCTADNAKELCEKYGVQGFPTIKHAASACCPRRALRTGVCFIDK